MCTCVLAHATLSHILCECPFTACIYNHHRCPDDPNFLRIYISLLSLDGTVLQSWIQAVTPHLRFGDKCGRLLVKDLSPIASVSPSDFLYVYWDGSFQPTGSGVGIAIHRKSDLMATFNVPVSAPVATRCESIGPSLISLLVYRLPF